MVALSALLPVLALTAQSPLMDSIRTLARDGPDSALVGRARHRPDDALEATGHVETSPDGGVLVVDDPAAIVQASDPLAAEPSAAPSVDPPSLITTRYVSLRALANCARPAFSAFCRSVPPRMRLFRTNASACSMFAAVAGFAAGENALTSELNSSKLNESTARRPCSIISQA